MIPTVTLRRSQTAVLLEVDAGEHGQLPYDWLVRWRLSVAQAAVHPDDYGTSDRTFAAARIRTRRAGALLALADEARGSVEPNRGTYRGKSGTRVGHLTPPIRLRRNPSRQNPKSRYQSTMDGDRL